MSCGWENNISRCRLTDLHTSTPPCDCARAPSRTRSRSQEKLARTATSESLSVMSLSCLGGREERCREEGVGGVRLESHTRETTGKGAVSYCAPLSSVCSSLYSPGACVHLCVSAVHGFLKVLPPVCQRCHVSSPGSSQRETHRSGPARLTITENSEQRICVLPPC